MCLYEPTMHPRLVCSILVGGALPSRPPLKALATLGASSPSQARADAERELARARPCRCCLTPRIHLTKYVGSTLFLDDDPAELQRAIPRAEHSSWTQRLVAACIILYGRPRLTLFERS
jgi:hypothetical protein